MSVWLIELEFYFSLVSHLWAHRMWWISSFICMFEAPPRLNIEHAQDIWFSSAFSADSILKIVFSSYSLFSFLVTLGSQLLTLAVCQNFSISKMLVSVIQFTYCLNWLDLCLVTRYQAMRGVVSVFHVSDKIVVNVLKFFRSW